METTCGKLILASQSPRRIELMKLITPDFLVCPSRFDENSLEEREPERLCAALARGKAAAIQAAPEDWVIGCDTIVVREGRVFGKPGNPEEARAMLRALSGGEHQVITGVCILHGGREHAFQSCTRVFFYPLTDAQIEAYIQSGEPFDKAGGYGIQGRCGLFAERIEGDYYNVVGLPVARLYQILQQIRPVEFSLN